MFCSYESVYMCAFVNIFALLRKSILGIVTIARGRDKTLSHIFHKPIKMLARTRQSNMSPLWGALTHIFMVCVDRGININEHMYIHIYMQRCLLSSQRADVCVCVCLYNIMTSYSFRAVQASLVLRQVYRYICKRSC